MTLAAQLFTSILPLFIAIGTVRQLHPMADTLTQSVGFNVADAAGILLQWSGETPTNASFGVVGILMTVISATSFARALGRAYGHIWSAPQSPRSGRMALHPEFHWEQRRQRIPSIIAPDSGVRHCPGRNLKADCRIAAGAALGLIEGEVPACRASKRAHVRSLVGPGSRIGVDENVRGHQARLAAIDDVPIGPPSWDLRLHTRALILRSFESSRHAPATYLSHRRVR